MWCGSHTNLPNIAFGHNYKRGTVRMHSVDQPHVESALLNNHRKTDAGGMCFGFRASMNGPVGIPVRKNEGRRGVGFK